MKQRTSRGVHDGGRTSCESLRRSVNSRLPPVTPLPLHHVGKPAGRSLLIGRTAPFFPQNRTFFMCLLNIDGDRDPSLATSGWLALPNRWASLPRAVVSLADSHLPQETMPLWLKMGIKLVRLTRTTLEFACLWQRQKSCRLDQDCLYTVKRQAGNWPTANCCSQDGSAYCPPSSATHPRVGRTEAQAASRIVRRPNHKTPNK